MLFGFAVLSMLMTPALSAEPQVKLPAKMIGTWCVSEESATQKLGTDIYDRVAKGTNCDGINIRQTSYDGLEYSYTIKKTERLAGDAYLARAACESEGSTFTDISTFRISAGQLVVTELEKIFQRRKDGNDDNPLTLTR
jgi:hypothetical protein